MLDRLDEVPWGALGHAYGPATDVPGLLRQAAGPDDEAVGHAITELYGNIFHQGTVYPATAAAVPFLVELARGAPCRRAEFAWLLGMLADDRHAYGPDRPPVRAAVAAHRADLAPLLADADPQLRAAAAYLTVQCGGMTEPVWERWSAEADPDVRAGLVLALGLGDPDRAATVVAEAVVSGEPAVRVAAALALIRTGAGWPEGAVAAVVRAMDEGADVEYAWKHHGELADELLLDAGPELATELLAAMLAGAQPATRRAGIGAVTPRCQALRSAPASLLPVLVPLLDDEDADVRTEVVGVLRRCGAAAAPYADRIAAIAAGYPATAGSGSITAARRAMETLVRLGDPRWIELAGRAPGDGASLRSAFVGAPWNPDVVDAVRQRLATLAAGGTSHPAVAELAQQLYEWGPRAAAAIPELLAVLPWAGRQVGLALLRMGHLEPAMEGPLRTLAGSSGNVEAALAVWRLTGDRRPVLGLLKTVLSTEDSWWGPMGAAVSALGEGVAPLVPRARAHLTGAAARTYPQRETQVLAARIVWAATGEVEPGLATLAAILGRGHKPAGSAAELVADVGAGQLRPAIQQRLGDYWCRVAAAGALWRLGVPPVELVAPLVDAIAEDGHGTHQAIELLVGMRATAAASALEQLAERDERVVVSGSDDDIVWNDEALRAQLRTAAASLRPGATAGS